MKHILFAVLFSMSASLVYAGGTTLGKNGNVYNSTGNGFRAHNGNTGSTWNAQTNGSVTQGTDSRGNSWTYNKSNGVYQNLGTGETRIRGKRW